MSDTKADWLELTKQVMATGPRSAGPEQQRLGSSRTSGPSQAPFDMSSLRNHLIPTQPTLVNPPAAAYSNAQWAGSFRPDQQQPQAGPSTWERNASPAAAQSAWAASFNPRSSEVQARSTPPLQAREQYASQTPEYRQRYTPNYPPSFPSFQAQYSMPSYVPSATHHHQLHTEMIQHAPQDQQMGHHAWPTTADFDMQAESSTARQETAPAKEFSEWDEPLPEVNWQDDIPADLNDILRLQPTIPEVLPLRPGATQETIPRNGQLNYNDQSALLMSDTSSTAYRRKSVHFRETSGVPSSLEEALAQSSTAIPGMTSSWEDPLVTDLSDFDEDAFMAFNGERGVAYDQRIGVGDMEGWGEMQKDWEELQNTMPKTKDEMRGADGRYLFQSRNPYAEEMASLGHRERQEGRESPTARVSCAGSGIVGLTKLMLLQGVLELEAAVQADPTDHSAWYALGLKQQENERESAAILALGKVVQLDPDYRPAYLALAVSYTNEGELQMANRMISKWIDLAPMASQLSAGVVRDEDESWREGQKVLVERLIGLARMSPEELDPDVQVALGVLFNSGEQFDKAEDCLLAALSVRPNVSFTSVFHLLKNRIG